jgi:uridylate kinase
MKIVFALGGSIVFPKELDEGYVERFSKFALELAQKNSLVIVVGGGKKARKAIAEARKKGANEVECDYEGIEASRYNASVISQAMGIEPQVPESLIQARQILATEGIVLMGGTEPGHSTDAVAALMAEYIDADLLLKVTDVDGIYDKDPQKFKGAKRFDKLAASELERMVKELSQDAGKYELMDLLGVKVVQRSKIKMIVLDGRDIENMKKAIEGKKFVGTAVE